MTLEELTGKYAPHKEDVRASSHRTSGATFKLLNVPAGQWRNLDDLREVEAVTDEAFDSWEDSLEQRK